MIKSMLIVLDSHRITQTRAARKKNGIFGVMGLILTVFTAKI